mgnify:CR=1 FL=1|jgi:hypothetical protein
MKIIDIKQKSSNNPVKVLDSCVCDGYLQGPGGSLADVDTDYQSDRRQEVKEYLEGRYNVKGRQRVFSAGTLTTLKIKAAIKDVARVHRVPLSLVNYITAIFEDDKMSWGDLFKLAVTNKKVHKFIQDYPQVIEDIRPLMGQPRSASVHASAILITPQTKDGEEMDCFDYTPIKRVDDMLVSEFDGYSLDEVGLLKNDCLGIKELSKIQSTINECNRVYHAEISFEEIVKGELNDSKVYELLSNGFCQNVFQFSSRGMTKFLMDMHPDCIGDLIAAAALYRPATLESGSAEKYLLCKCGDIAPVYLWGTYEALKESYGLLTYQESLAQIAREVGGFSLGEGVGLLKLISKKRTDKIHAMKEKFMIGAKERGCPKEDAVQIWGMIESGGSYLFNKCISGKETIYRPHGGKWKPTIGEMYRILNDRDYAQETGHLNLHEKYKYKGYGLGFSLNEEKRLVKNRIKDIRFEGTKPLYRITLESGKTIDVTANHKHPTQRGEVRTDCLNVGEDSLFISLGSVKQDTTYRFTDKGMVNNNLYHDTYDSVEYELNSQKGHMGFTKRPDSEYVKLKYYHKNLMRSSCENCGDSNCRLEIHHKNGDHSTCGENFDNLTTLCVSCHKKAHYRMGRRKMGEHGLYTELRKVVSIEYIGEDEVYDVEMEAPHHSFVTTNGVVTCNSHATAYAITAYVGAFLKANYPTAFYTVALQWADDKEIPALMSEMEQCSGAKIVPPDVNVSDVKFYTDYRTDEIFWSLTRIKMLGVKAVEYIISERYRGGDFSSIENFIHRIFRYKLKKYSYWDDPDNADEVTRVPVNARHIKNMILAGCFDKMEQIETITDRYDIVKRAAKELGFELSEKDFPRDLLDKHYYWSMQQIAVSGIGSIDYRRIFDASQTKSKVKGKASWMELRSAMDLDNEGKRVVVCATVTEVEEKSYKDKISGEKKRFAKLTLQQNNDLMELVCWSDFLGELKVPITSLKDKVIIVSAIIKYSDYTGANSLNTHKTSIMEQM